MVHIDTDDLPGSADAHDRIRGARLPSVVHPLPSSQGVTEKQTNKQTQIHSKLLQYFAELQTTID